MCAPLCKLAPESAPPPPSLYAPTWIDTEHSIILYFTTLHTFPGLSLVHYAGRWRPHIAHEASVDKRFLYDKVLDT